METKNIILKLRTERGMSQDELAGKVMVTRQAVSRWENGKSLPDASIMLELCKLLNINVNELLTGERLNMENYKEMAEENLVQMRKQEELSNKKMLALEKVIVLMCLISFMIMVFAASFAVDNTIWRIVLILGGTVIFIMGVFYAVKLERDAGYYECPNCKNRYVPTMRDVFMAPHYGRNRKMRCPYCNEKGYHKKVLTK